VSLSPVSAIADMVAPVVLITLAVIFSNGLMTTLTTVGDRVLTMDLERSGILRGPHGEMLDEDSVPPVDRDRLTQLRDLMPLMIRLVRRLRMAVLIMWIAIGLLVLSVAAIAVGVTARSEAFAFVALALVLAGVGGVFACVIMVIGPMARPTDASIDAAGRRMGVLR
jgi:hypothetical protein